MIKTRILRVTKGTGLSPRSTAALLKEALDQCQGRIIAVVPCEAPSPHMLDFVIVTEEDRSAEYTATVKP